MNAKTLHIYESKMMEERKNQDYLSISYTFLFKKIASFRFFLLSCSHW
jgi:hypothetical protein